MLIRLNNLYFYAAHGLYEEEKSVRNQFEVNVEIEYFPAQMPVKDISQAIDYAEVYELVKAFMQEPQELLETLAIQIVAGILDRFSKAEKATVSIKKLFPPFKIYLGNVEVVFSKSRQG